jgi:hypothetical protein
VRSSIPLLWPAGLGRSSQHSPAVWRSDGGALRFRWANKGSGRPATSAFGRLAISHLASDLEREKLNDSRDRVNRISHQQYTHRSHADVLRFFDGLEMVEPRLVELRHWRATIEASRATPGWCGLARKA